MAAEGVVLFCYNSVYIILLIILGAFSLYEGQRLEDNIAFETSSLNN